MDYIIRQLDTAKKDLIETDGTFDRIALDHGSPDQTRAILIESIIKNALSHINAAIDQIEILNRHLY